MNIVIYQLERQRQNSMKYYRERETMITNVPCHCYTVTSVLKLKHGNKKII